MKVRLPGIKRGEERVIEWTIPNVLSDVPEGLKQFLFFLLIILIGGISILYILTMLTEY